RDEGLVRDVLADLEVEQAVATGDAEVRHRLPIQPEGPAEIDVAADTEPAALERGVPLEVLAFAMVRKADDRIPHPGFPRERREISQRHVVLQREAPDAAGDEEVVADVASYGAVAVDHVDVHGEIRQPRLAIAADGRPQAVGVYAPRAIG